MTEPGPTLPLTGDDADAVAALVHAAEQAVGQELVTRPRFRDAAGGGGGDLAGVVTWSADRRQPLAYVQAARTDRRWDLELAGAADAESRADGEGQGRVLPVLPVLRG